MTEISVLVIWELENWKLFGMWLLGFGILDSMRFALGPLRFLG